MTRIGYVLEGARDDYNKLYPEFVNAEISLETCQKRLIENPARPTNVTGQTLTYNALWRLKSLEPANDMDSWDYPTLHPKRKNGLVPQFSAQEYARCEQN